MTPDQVLLQALQVGRVHAYFGECPKSGVDSVNIGRLIIEECFNSGTNRGDPSACIGIDFDGHSTGCNVDHRGQVNGIFAQVECIHPFLVTKGDAGVNADTLGIPRAVFHGEAMKIDVVLFDLDGTLLNSLPDLADAVNRVRAHLGLSNLAEESIEAGIGLGLSHLLEASLPLEHHPRIPELRPIFMAHYQGHLLARSRPYPGVETLLRTLHCRTGLVTNKPRRFGGPILARLGWSFDVVVFGDDCPTRKPDPGPLSYAAEQLGCLPGEVLFIGDRSYDRDAAEAAGMAFRAVPWAPQLGAWRLESLEELHSIVEGGRE